MTALTLRSVANAIGGDIVGGQVLAPGPNHSRKDRSLAVRLTTHGILVHSHAGDDWQQCRDYVAQRLGIERSPHRDNPSPAEQAHARAKRQLDERLEAQREAERITFAVRLFNEAEGPYRSPVEAYLRSRNVALPEMGAGEWVRFHPSCPFAGQRTPAMVCLVRDMVTDKPKAVHRTALDRDGRAIELNGNKRLSFGPIGGGAIKITPHADVFQELGIGEGLESTLSLPHIREFGDRPLWALLSAGNLGKLPMFLGLKKLWIAVDHDSPGLRASRELAACWRAAEREARLFIPTTPKLDLNDLAMGGRLA
jgi:putative DNA primase/helicase